MPFGLRIQYCGKRCWDKKDSAIGHGDLKVKNNENINKSRQPGVVVAQYPTSPPSRTNVVPSQQQLSPPIQQTNRSPSPKYSDQQNYYSQTNNSSPGLGATKSLDNLKNGLKSAAINQIKKLGPNDVDNFVNGYSGNNTENTTEAGEANTTGGMISGFVDGFIGNNNTDDVSRYDGSNTENAPSSGNAAFANTIRTILQPQNGAQQETRRNSSDYSSSDDSDYGRGGKVSKNRARIDNNNAANNDGGFYVSTQQPYQSITQHAVVSPTSQPQRHPLPRIPNSQPQQPYSPRTPVSQSQQPYSPRTPVSQSQQPYSPRTPVSQSQQPYLPRTPISQSQQPRTPVSQSQQPYSPRTPVSQSQQPYSQPTSPNYQPPQYQNNPSSSQSANGSVPPQQPMQRGTNNVAQNQVGQPQRVNHQHAANGGNNKTNTGANVLAGIRGFNNAVNTVNKVLNTGNNNSDDNGNNTNDTDSTSIPASIINGNFDPVQQIQNANMTSIVASSGKMAMKLFGNKLAKKAAKKAAENTRKVDSDSFPATANEAGYEYGNANPNANPNVNPNVNPNANPNVNPNANPNGTRGRRVDISAAAAATNAIYNEYRKQVQNSEFVPSQFSQSVISPTSSVSDEGFVDATTEKNSIDYSAVANVLGQNASDTYRQIFTSN
ncbi:3704_t:CDS:2 [Paraglomus brasilianum]|uniref:3704_t:CDS:1 n=1 Tax=Paraglomus brasilianum TaxID=144538 RepID=A0A9N9G2B6_9GLOM|nr:3704_t:CDS:2 [Paraglomus brasilianum]